MRNVNLFLAFVKYECIVKSVIKRIPDFIVQKQFTASYMVSFCLSNYTFLCELRDIEQE